MAVSFKLDYDTSKLSNGVSRMAEKVGAAVLMYASTQAIRIETKMKVDRPWTDRTGMAKATLRARVTQPRTNVVRILLAHGVDYGIWLELAHERNYAIIAPTIARESPNVLNGLNGIVAKLR